MMLDSPERDKYHQEIWIDIIPIDPFPPFQNSRDEINFVIIREIFIATCNNILMKKLLINYPEHWFFLRADQLTEIVNLSLKQRGKILEDQLNLFDFESEFVHTPLQLYSVINPEKSYRREWFNETIYLPFEEISIPVPKFYNEILTKLFGNWHLEKITHSHTKIYSADLSYKEYFSAQNEFDNLCKRSNSLRSKLKIDEMRNGKLVTFWKKKIWKSQLDLILELKRVCEKFNLRFWAIDQTLFAARKIHGFDPSNDFVTVEMTQSDFEKLEIHFPYRLIVKNSGGGGNFSTRELLSFGFQKTKIELKEFSSRSKRQIKFLMKLNIYLSNSHRSQLRRISRLQIESRKNSTVQ